MSSFMLFSICATYCTLSNGFVCSNTEEFVKAIKEAQNGADGFTERAYQDVLNMYNTKAMAKQYSEKYDKAINTPRGGYSMS